jgi:periplasmic protein TonB
MRTLSETKFQKAALVLRTAIFAVAALGTTVGVAIADPIHVSEAEAKTAAVARVIPAVPPIAKQAHISGRVVVELTVNEEGNVEKVDVVSGNPILASAATKAGKNWMFNPFKGPDGKPSKAVVRLAFEF